MQFHFHFDLIVNLQTMPTGHLIAGWKFNFELTQ